MDNPCKDSVWIVLLTRDSVTHFVYDSGIILHVAIFIFIGFCVMKAGLTCHSSTSMFQAQVAIWSLIKEPKHM